MATFKKSAQRILVMLVLLVYPTWYLWPALGSDGCRLIGAKPTDVGASIVSARVYKQLWWPWSHQSITNAPSGEMAWRWQELSQLSSRLLLGAVSKLVDACSAVNIYMLLGWALTGFSVYLLARTLGSRPAIAISVAVLSEMLPWWRVRVEHIPAYLHFWPLVLLVVVLCRHELSGRALRKGHVAAAALVAMTFDPYMAWYAVIIMLVYFVLVALDREEGERIKAALTILGVCLAFGAMVNALLYGIDWYQNAGKPGYTGRRLGVASESFIRYFSGSLSDWLRPGPGHPVAPMATLHDRNWLDEFPQYVGAIGIIGAASFFVRGMFPNHVVRRFLGMLSVLGVLFTLAPVLSAGPLSIPNITYILRFLTVGLRHFGRFGSLGQLVLLATAAVALERLTALGERRLGRSALTVLVPVILLLTADLYPWTGRQTFDLSNDLTVLQQTIRNSGGDSVLVLPFGGQADNVRVYTTLRTVNPLFGSADQENIENAASLGGAQFAGLLRKMGVEYVLIARRDPSQGTWNQYPLLYELPKEYFSLESSLILPGAYYGERVVFDLYRLVGRPGVLCDPCRPGPFRTAPELSGDVLGVEGSIRWSLGDEVRLSVPRSRGRSSRYWVTISVNTLVDNRPLAVRVGGRRFIFWSTGNRASIQFSLTSEETATLEAPGECPSPAQLRIAPDPRHLCYSFAAILVEPMPSVRRLGQ